MTIINNTQIRSLIFIFELKLPEAVNSTTTLQHFKISKYRKAMSNGIDQNPLITFLNLIRLFDCNLKYIVNIIDFNI